ncbi:MAG: TetR/AcrR family transcriptional regulator [Gemmatimonadaceae bacterium]
MPRPFSEGERERISGALLEAGRTHFARHGVRKANVEGLTREVGIAKGSFYLFFASKEALFFAVLLDLEQELRARLIERMQRSFGSAAELVEVLLRTQFESLETHPLLAILNNPDEAMPLLRAIPPERLRDARDDDQRFFAELITDGVAANGIACQLTPRDIDMLAALPRALYVMGLHPVLLDQALVPELRELFVTSVATAVAARGAASAPPSRKRRSG